MKLTKIFTKMVWIHVNIALLHKWWYIALSSPINCLENYGWFHNKWPYVYFESKLQDINIQLTQLNSSNILLRSFFNNLKHPKTPPEDGTLIWVSALVGNSDVIAGPTVWCCHHYIFWAT